MNRRRNGEINSKFKVTREKTWPYPTEHYFCFLLRTAPDNRERHRINSFLSLYFWRGTFFGGNVVFGNRLRLNNIHVYLASTEWYVRQPLKIYVTSETLCLRALLRRLAEIL